MTRLKYEIDRPADADTPAKRLAKLRKDRGLRQADVAEKLGITRSTYVGYENLDRTPPWQLLCAIADLYGVTIDYILCHTDRQGNLSPRVEGKPVLVADREGTVTDLWYQGSDTDKEVLTEYLQMCYQMYATASDSWKRQENLDHLLQLIKIISSIRPDLKERLTLLGDKVQTTKHPCRDIFDAAQGQINTSLEEIYRDAVKDAIISSL